MKKLIIIFTFFQLCNCEQSREQDSFEPDDLPIDTDAISEDEILSEIQTDINEFLETFNEKEEEITLPLPDLSKKLVSGEVRAGRIVKKEDLIGGRTAKGTIGDYKIYNSKVAFIIQDVGIKSGYKRYGGMIVDADVIREEGENGNSQLGELFFGYNQRIFYPKSVEIVSDGQTADRAIIRIYGEDAHFPWLGSFLEAFFPINPVNCDLIYEYSLEPDDEALEIDIIIKNRNDETLVIDMNEVAFIMGDGCDTFFNKVGFLQKNQTGKFPYWMALGKNISYGLLSMEGEIDVLGSYSNVTFGIFPLFEMKAKGEHMMTRYFAVSGGGLSEIQRIFRSIKSIGGAGKLKGIIKADKEAYENGIRVHVQTAENKEYYSVILPDENGNIDNELSKGKYELIAKSNGFISSDPVSVEIKEGEETQVEITIPSSTRFEYLITEDGINQIPARLTFLRQDMPPNTKPPNIMPEKYNEEGYSFGAALIIHSGTGEGTGIIPDGKYKVVATRGIEYEMDSQIIDFDGNTQYLTFTIPRTVDSSGYVSGDFHVHAENSPDTNIPNEHRIRTSLAENVEVLCMTDHDTISDLAPYVETIPSASEYVKVMIGSEITTYIYGHFQAFPLTVKPDQINNGGIDWFDTTAPELFEKIRKSEDHDVIIQVNHPTSPSIGGYFSALGMDWKSGTMKYPDNWSDNFDAIEVYNAGCGGEQNKSALAFWFDFLNRGYRFSISEGSDTHSPDIGYIRLFLKTNNDIKNFQPEELVTNFRNQQVFVSCGPFVRFSINEHESGELVSYDGSLYAYIQISGPSYMKFTDFRIINNGTEIFTLEYNDWKSGEGSVKFEDTIELSPTSDGWYVLEVRGSGDISPVSSVTPYAITNPIYVDFDNNGKFDPILPKY